MSQRIIIKLVRTPFASWIFVFLLALCVFYPGACKTRSVKGDWTLMINIKITSYMIDILCIIRKLTPPPNLPSITPLPILKIFYKGNKLKTCLKYFCCQLLCTPNIPLSDNNFSIRCDRRQHCVMYQYWGFFSLPCINSLNAIDMESKAIMRNLSLNMLNVV